MNTAIKEQRGERWRSGAGLGLEWVWCLQVRSVRFLEYAREQQKVLWETERGPEWPWVRLCLGSLSFTSPFSGTCDHVASLRANLPEVATWFNLWCSKNTKKSLVKTQHGNSFYVRKVPTEAEVTQIRRWTMQHHCTGWVADWSDVCRQKIVRESQVSVG